MNKSFYKKIALTAAILLAVFGALFFPTRNVDKPSTDMLSNQEVLESFFRRLIVREGFGYTIFGNKPVSLTGYFDPVPVDNWDRIRGNDLIKVGWLAWKDYLDKMTLENYLFLEEVSEGCASLKIISCVNKRAFVEIVDRHRVVFEKILKRNISGASLFEELEHHPAGLFDLLNRHEGLYGLLLGFGQENSFLFQRRKELNIYATLPTFSLSAGVPSKSHLSLEEEIHFLKNLDRVADDNLLYPVALPAFIGIRKSEESKQLMAEYQSVRKRLTNLLYSDNFMKDLVLKLSQ